MTNNTLSHQTFSLFFYGSIAVIALLVNFYLLNKGLILSDEGWYYCLLRDCPDVNYPTRFFLIFHNIFNNNIYAIRLFMYCMNFISIAFLTFGVYKFNKRFNAINNRKSFWFLLAMAFIGQTYISNSYSINYATLNSVVASISVGFLLMGISQNKWYWLVLSGFFIGFLFPIIFTNGVVLLFVFVFIWLVCKEYKWKAYLHYIIGLCIFAIYYFLFVQTPLETLATFISFFKSSTADATKNHGAIFIIIWILKTYAYYIQILIYSAIFVFVTTQINIASSKKKRIILFGIFISTFIVYLYAAYNHNDAFEIIRVESLLFCFLFVLLLSQIKSIHAPILYLISLFAIMPFCLSLGTDVLFIHRGRLYLFYVTLGIAILLNKNIQNHLFAIVALILFVKFVYSLSGSDWYGNKYLQQNKSVASLGIDQNLYVDEDVYNMTKTIKENLSNDADILCETEEWGFCALLEKKPVNYDFRIKSDKMIEISEEYIQKNQPLDVLVYKLYSDFSFYDYADSMKFDKIDVGKDRTLYKIRK